MKHYSMILAFLVLSALSLPAEDSLLNLQEKQLIAHVKDSIQSAEKGISNLSEGVLQIPGMSSPKVRHLLNNLCSLSGTSYLEIGCWKGSTWIAALFGNQRTITSAIAIDNWSEFNGPRNDFLHNWSSYLPNRPDTYRFYSENSFRISLKDVFHLPVNLYFYDGNHQLESQEKAFTYYDAVFDHLFIAVVDDWNWADTQQGTRTAFDKLGYEVLFEISLPSTHNGDLNLWWNGLYVAVIRKP